MRWIGILVVAALGLGGLLQAFEEDLNPDDYPTCSEIVRYPGTYADAYCADGDDVIEADEYYTWDTYHPSW